jgi:hypothetical protein
MGIKTKQTQKEDLQNVHGRDLFMTPNYATELLIPFIDDLLPMNPAKKFIIWECAAGQKKMSNILTKKGFDVVSTDLSYDESFNFLLDEPIFEYDCIVTNPPFSLKKKFYDKCASLGKPFALLIPADYSGWIIDAIKKGAEKIIPTRRIDYITPNILNRIREGEIWEKYLVESFGNIYKNVSDFKKRLPLELEKALSDYPDFHVYESIYSAPKNLLRKYSSSDFHSMWLTWGFGLGKTETFVELTNEMKDNI